MPPIPTEWPLRLGCGLVNVYSGYHLLIEPTRYHHFVPAWLASGVESIASVDAFLRVQGVGELLIALGLLGWFLPRFVVCAAAGALVFQMTLILHFVGIDEITFRNAGLLGASYALMIESVNRLLSKERRRVAGRYCPVSPTACPYQPAPHAGTALAYEQNRFADMSSLPPLDPPHVIRR